MSTLVVKDLPAHLHEALKARARRHHRSLNKEAASIIEQAVHAGDMQSIQHGPAPMGQPLTLEELDVALSDDRYCSLGTLADVEELMDELRAERGDPRE
ncbi:FitA-like ribbon-helix-helix domain-containing protein [Salinisphaera sp. RV14]|uniref:FitA-like ribbon-helix-helix domain-containing protein n=1 Tax=unclassified Salinisphaera TaxID=2649847 RepID=UPI003F84E59B